MYVVVASKKPCENIVMCTPQYLPEGFAFKGDSYLILNSGMKCEIRNTPKVGLSLPWRPKFHGTLYVGTFLMKLVLQFF